MPQGKPTPSAVTLLQLQGFQPSCTITLVQFIEPKSESVLWIASVPGLVAWGDSAQDALATLGTQVAAVGSIPNHSNN